MVVNSEGLHIAVFEEGRSDGPTVLLVSGHPDTHTVWDPVVAHLQDRFRIVRYDPRGAGDSSVPSGTAAYRLARLADDFAAVLAAISVDSDVHVVAHGWGSSAVWEHLTRPRGGTSVASFTSVAGTDLTHLRRYLVDSLRHPHRPRRFLRGAAQLGRLAAAAPRLLSDKQCRANVRGDGAGGDLDVDVPVQLIVATADEYLGPHVYDYMAARVTQLWRRDVKAGRDIVSSHPQVLARAVAQFVEHLRGAPAARELRRAQVGRARNAFTDNLVAVTGAGSGIGRETALAFARAGADVVISDIDQQGLAETARRVAAEGAEAHSYRLDVADAAAVEAFAAQVCATHGVPDVVVNNAGVGHAGFFLDTPAEEFDRVMDINFGGVVNGCRAFAPRLVERGIGGHIVNVASMASYTPVNVMNAYCTSKAAVFMFSDCLRAELDAAGVGLTTICPGVIGTNIVETTRFSLPQARLGEVDTVRGRARRGFSVRRYGPEKVAAAIVDAVVRKQAVRPVTFEAYAVYGVSHALPQVMRSTARGGNIL
ncbi:SDR family oxidoreductase [Mycolicibacterium sp. S3B2]|uniref:SDR family oxidoreductase n=1 Tax=Mycolicibacterium sp. S3B2 TaxID=3415120 RepID=UPI003C7E7654